MNISRNLAFGLREKKSWGFKKLQGGAKINVRWWENFFGSTKSFRGTVKFLYFVGAPFEFNGRAPFKLVTPLLVLKVNADKI